MEAVFEEAQLHVTTSTPRCVRAFDIIRLVNNSTNPRVDWRRYAVDPCEQNLDNKETAEAVLAGSYMHQFEGQGQRPTPVVNADAALGLMFLIGSPLARQFVSGALGTLTKFLRGDETLHTELDDNAERQAEVPADHSLQVFAPPQPTEHHVHILFPHHDWKVFASIL